MIRIRVPATTANLGPGFDTLGLALNIYNEFTFQEISKGLKIGGFPKRYSSATNIVYKSFMKTLNIIGYPLKGIKIGAAANIPISRGLGSSASCILAGVIGANVLAGQALNNNEILEIATSIEGHPDNIAPALFGGFVISLMEGSNIIYNRLEIDKGIRLVALIPEFTLTTKKARQVLPATIGHSDCINNVSRVALLVSALSNGKFQLLRHAFDDRLHEPYRGKLIPNYFNILRKCKELNNLGCYLSGAGPTIMCIIEEEDKHFVEGIGNYLESLEQVWDVKELEIDLLGAKVL